MKKIFTIVFCCLLVVALIGCAPADTIVSVNVDSTTGLTNGVFGKSAMVEIGDCLWYDSTTRIVYWWNGNIGSNWATTPSPYYAPNGLPYRYNPETNTFEEINGGSNHG